LLPSAKIFKTTLGVSAEAIPTRQQAAGHPHERRMQRRLRPTSQRVDCPLFVRVRVQTGPNERQCNDQKKASLIGVNWEEPMLLPTRNGLETHSTFGRDLPTESTVSQSRVAARVTDPRRDFRVAMALDSLGTIRRQTRRYRAVGPRPRGAAAHHVYRSNTARGRSAAWPRAQARRARTSLTGGVPQRASAVARAVGGASSRAAWLVGFPPPRGPGLTPPRQLTRSSTGPASTCAAW
jgi:hypothetical protein